MLQDDSIYHAFHKRAEDNKKKRNATPPPRAAKNKIPENYREFSTLDTKTHLSKILREMERGDFDGAIITSYGRQVGVLFPDRRLRGG
jgi:hypothetical protein